MWYHTPRVDRPNGDALRKCILEGPYTPSTITIPVVPATDDSPEVPERTAVETILNMSPENKEHYQSEKEAIHLLLTGNGDEIYSTIFACKTTHDMWIATERIQQGESLNIQDVKTNLFWEFGKFTSHYRESNATTKYKGKEIAKLITHISESASKEDNDPEQAQRDKDMQKNLALIAKYFQKIYKPTNNNLRTSSNSKNNNVDTSLRYMKIEKSDCAFYGIKYNRLLLGVQHEDLGSQETKKGKRLHVSQGKDVCANKLKRFLITNETEQADWLRTRIEEIDEQFRSTLHYKAGHVICICVIL
ncbi:hypothetical protein Tco_1316088 [Tanacetum coccineum]